eukprot:COSAG02_NODE_1173_length_14105_cov_15.197701_17_plen_77_part_00
MYSSRGTGAPSARPCVNTTCAPGARACARLRMAGRPAGQQRRETIEFYSRLVLHVPVRSRPRPLRSAGRFDHKQSP